MTDKLPETINSNNFPAKLWRMVNNPANSAICWDTTGQIIVIDQQLFENVVLSPSYKDDEGNNNSFKTTHFSSFVRQLNLYGFRKTETLSYTGPFVDNTFKSPERQKAIHHFYNPNFRRDYPALLINLKRLTVDNKTKMERGIDVTCRPPSKSQRDWYEKEADSEKVMIKGRARKMSPHPPYYTNHKLLAPHNGTPVPPRHLTQGHIVPSLGPPYSAVLSSALQQGVRYGFNYGASNFTRIQPQNGHYHPGFYSPAYQRIPVMAMTNGMNRPFPPIGYYSAYYPLDLPNSQNRIQEENFKTDVNLDRVFQIADEVMLNQPNDNLIKIVTPEMQSSFPSQGNLQDDALQNKSVDSGPSFVSASGDAAVQPDSNTGEFMKPTPGEAMDEDTKEGQIKVEVIKVDDSNTSDSELCQV